MQNAALRAAGLDWSSEILDVASDHLPAAVESLRDPVVTGANVSIPHKVAVMPLLDALEGEATSAGAVNTIRCQGRRLIGSNTDITAVRVALGTVGVEPDGARVVVLGVGGSARAAAVGRRGADVALVGTLVE